MLDKWQSCKISKQCRQSTARAKFRNISLKNTHYKNKQTWKRPLLWSNIKIGAIETAQRRHASSGWITPRASVGPTARKVDWYVNPGSQTAVQELGVWQPTQAFSESSLYTFLNEETTHMIKARHIKPFSANIDKKSRKTDPTIKILGPPTGECRCRRQRRWARSPHPSSEP